MNKTVIVTGGAGGIGSAVSSLFAQKGYNVIIGYNNSDKAARELSESLNEKGYITLPYKIDVRNTEDIKSAFSYARNVFGSTDILVNNAGVSYIGLITELEDCKTNEIFGVNLIGCYNCCRVASEYMVAQKSGRIINISSIWGEVGASCEVAYSASKAGVIGLTKALAKELAPSDITVNAVSPGITNTKMNGELSKDDIKAFVSDIPIERMARPEEIAAAVYYLASDDAAYITGQIFSVNGGLS